MGAKRILTWLVLANALDLGSSLSLHGADQDPPLPEKPLWLLCVQLALLPGVLLVSWRLAPIVTQALAAIPAPRALKFAIAAVALVQLGHVALRTEHYPFSAVTMFSNYLPNPGAPTRRISTFLVDTSEGPKPISFLREGNPYFAEYLHADYKAGWILGTFGQQDADSERKVAALLAQAGAQRPRLATIELDTKSGDFRIVAQRGGGR